MLAFISGISPIGMIVILVIALLIFGNRLPEVARSIGKALTEFKRGLRDAGEDTTSNDPPRKLDSPDQTLGDGPEAARDREAEPVSRSDQNRD